MGTVTILNTTTLNPITTMGERAGVCWGANTADAEKNYKRGLDCLESGHGRVQEFVNVEMVLDGWSARVIREWYTHIGGAPTRLQASTRYIDYSWFDYVVPDSIARNTDAFNEYKKCMESISNSLMVLEGIYEIPREDSAMLLPLGMTTRVVDKRNLRNLIDMSHQRLCNRAYHEYRKLINEIMSELCKYSEEWTTIVEKYMVPKCDYLGYCPEKKGCGRVPNKK